MVAVGSPGRLCRMSAALEKQFPGLRAGRYQKTSLATPAYNCIAWAAGEDKRYWWPRSRPFAYWPYGVDESETLPAFQAAFATLRYEVCADDRLEPGFEKIAIYADSNGAVKHAARQLGNGAWTSKLGPDIDISHDLTAVSGSLYGSPKLIMRRATTVSPSTSVEPPAGHPG